MGYQSIIRTMKVGFMETNYPVPDGIEEGDKLEWIHRHAAETGCDCLQVRYPFETHSKETAMIFTNMREKYGMEYDINISLPVFTILKPGGEDIAAELRRRCQIVKTLGMDMLRTVYGGLKIASSRFAKPLSAAAEQKENYVAALKACAKILEEEGVYLSVENHIDFSGREQAEMLDAVDSPFVGCAMDTANGIPVFSDPNDDIQALAPYTFTTHMKDFEILQEILPGRIPFMASACAVGDGVVDFSRTLHLFAKYSPFRKGLHLIVESAAALPMHTALSATEKQELARQRIDRSVACLLKLRAGDE